MKTRNTLLIITLLIIGLFSAKAQSVKPDPTPQEGKTFLETNKLNPAVVTLPSGLQYKILKEGQGAKPGINDQVTVHYQCALVNGRVVDNSYGKEPIKGKVTQFVKGWIEALQLMPLGSKWELYVPTELAYNETTGQGSYPPYSAMVFEVELLEIKAPEVVKPYPSAKESSEFLEKNRTAPGVKVTASGLQYKIIKEGTGEKPSATSTVGISSVCRFVNGRKWTQTWPAGKPVSWDLTMFPPSEGIREALSMMPVGSKWMLYLSPSLGYPAGVLNLPEESTIICELELLEIIKK